MNSPPTAIRTTFFLITLLAPLSAGCLNVQTPREISVNTDVGTRERVDTSSVPPTASHEEARQKLANAYAEIRSLRSDVASLERDKKDLKRERDDCRKEVKQVQKAQKKMQEESDD
jgi:predicted RNase H-like nuclease (RuvC/YqgF family)